MNDKASLSSKNQLRRFSNRIVGCPGCGEPRDDLRDDPNGDFVLFEDYERLTAEYGKVIIANAEVATINVEQLKTIGQLRAVLERTAGALNGLRADVEHALWPDSGFAPAAPESRDG